VPPLTDPAQLPSGEELVTDPMGSLGTTVTVIDAFAELSATDVAVIVTVAGVGTTFGAM
jgi:hypothetical protein